MLSHLYSNSNIVLWLINFSKNHYIIATISPLISYWVWKYLSRPKNLPPGPINVPFFGGAWVLTSSPFKDFENLWKNYGDIVSIYVGSKLMIYIYSKRLLKEVYVTRGDDFQARITESLPFDDVIFHQPYGEQWKKSKKTIVQLYKKLVIDKLEEKCVESIDDLTREISQYNGADVNPKNLLRQFNAQLIYSLYFLEKKSIKDDELREIGEAIAEFYKSTYIYYNSWVLFLPFSSFIFRKNLKKPGEIIKKLRKFYEPRYLQRLKTKNYEKNTPSDLMEGLMKNLDHISKIQTVDTMLVLSIDAIHSQTLILQACIYFLAYYKDIQKEIHDLLDKVVGDQTPTLEHRQELALIDGLYLEILRLDDILSSNSGHHAIRDTTLEGYNIPADAVLVPVSSSVHFDETYYPQPEKFNPKRFVKDGKLSFKRDEYFSFGIGPRTCTGQPYARAVAFLVLARILHLFTIKSEITTKDWEAEIKYMAEIPDFKVTFHPRR